MPTQGPDAALKRHSRPQKARLPVPTKAALNEHALRMKTRIINDRPSNATSVRPVVEQSHSLGSSKDIASERILTTGKKVTILEPVDMEPATCSSLSVEVDHATVDRQSSNSEAELENEPVGESWGKFRKLGSLLQDHVKWLVCSQSASGKLVMFKALGSRNAEAEREVLGRLESPHVSKIIHHFTDNGIVYLGYEYFRFTLEDLIITNMGMAETHVHYIARTLFHVVAALAQIKTCHGSICAQNVRVRTNDGHIILTGFEHSRAIGSSAMPQDDLLHLGFLILDCMDNRVIQRDVEDVLKHRLKNRVFGLEEAERWSGCKQLVDFLDDLFNMQKPVLSKVTNLFVSRSGGGAQCLRPLLDLAALQCFAPWVPVAEV